MYNMKMIVYCTDLLRIIHNLRKSSCLSVSIYDTSGNFDEYVTVVDSILSYLPSPAEAVDTPLTCTLIKRYILSCYLDNNYNYSALYYSSYSYVVQPDRMCGY